MPHVAHVHVADASGDGEEGLQIFDGIIDWEYVALILKKHKDQFTWIPEIWQGHRDNNSGFSSALEKLRRIL
jgi:sugar phosphate isomerase/epimerase